MALTFSIDLSKTCRPDQEQVVPESYGELPEPQGTIGPQKGMAFPLIEGGLLFPSEGIISDTAGSLALVFRPRTPGSSGALLGACGRFEPHRPFLAVSDRRVVLNIWHEEIAIRIHQVKDKVYTVRASWDHRSGVTLEVQPEGQPPQRLQRKLSWKPFHQGYVPFSIGGLAGGPRYSKWSNEFDGWISSVKTWDTPQDCPGAALVSTSEEKPLLPLADGIRVLDIDHPEIIPDPLELQMIPDRIDDLRMTREVAELDAITAKAKDEIEVFSALTHWVANLWPHGNYWPWAKGEQREIFWKRGWEMIPEIQAGRMGGMCGGFAHVMEEVFWAMGFQARRIQVRNHSSFEAYSNQAGKWIVCDASLNRSCYMFQDTHGTFLGAADIIRRHEALAHDPYALDDIQIRVCKEENLAAPQKHDICEHQGEQFGSGYDILGFYTGHDNDYQTRPMAWYYREADREAFRQSTMTVDKKNFLVEDLNQMNPSQNRVEPTFSWLDEGSVLAVSAQSVCTPFLQNITLQVDSEESEAMSDCFHWSLHEGVNELNLWTVNQMGASGHPFKITLWKEPA